MKNYFIILLIAMVQLNSCQDKKYKDMNPEEKAKVDAEINNRPSDIWPTNKDENGDYYYNVNMGTMAGYLAEDAGSHFVTDKESVSIPAMMLGENWGEGTGSYVLNDEYHPLPKKLYVAWFSATENKFYEGLFDMPYDKIKEEFDKMWPTFAPNTITTVASKYERFTDIIVGIAPKGDVVVWLSSLFQQIEIGRYKAKETTKITWQDFAEMNGMGEGATRENYLRNITKSTFPLPIGKVEQYEQKYIWKTKIESTPKMDIFSVDIFSFNGEKRSIYAEKDDNNYFLGSLPKNIEVSIKLTNKKVYLLKVTFDEKDLYDAFQKLGNDNKMDLVFKFKDDEIDKILLRNEHFEYVFNPEKLEFYDSQREDYFENIEYLKKE